MKRSTKILIMMLMLTMPINKIEPQKVYNTDRIEYSAPIEEGQNFLTDITIEGINFQFKPEITRYIIDVPYSKEKLNLKYVKADENATVETSGSNDLKVGENSYVVIVTNAAGEVREYDFKINRSEDRTYVINNEAAIEDALKTSTSAKLVVELIGESSKLNSEAVKAIKDRNKTIEFEWKDTDGKTLESIIINSDIVKDEDEINPNIKKEITSKKLLKKLSDVEEYKAFNTFDTNLPVDTTYKLAVDTDEDTYVVYFDKGGVVSNRTIKNIDGYVEFSIEKDVDYALVSNSNKPSSFIGGFTIIIPILIVVVLLVVFGFIYRKNIAKIIKNTHNK